LIVDRQTKTLTLDNLFLLITMFAKNKTSEHPNLSDQFLNSKSFHNHDWNIQMWRKRTSRTTTV